MPRVNAPERPARRSKLIFGEFRPPAGDGHADHQIGGRTRARTWDPLIKSQLLYQLSYAPAGAREHSRKKGRAGFGETTNPVWERSL